MTVLICIALVIWIVVGLAESLHLLLKLGLLAEQYKQTEVARNALKQLNDSL